MTKEIIVNAGELESRVAILENGRLMEVHIEREPKIVGNIYRGRVTKVLKGMDAAFVDIGVERNAFLSASDIVPEEEDEGSNGRPSRRHVPPINQLLRGGQEILVQVLRAPMGTKGARITTRLSLPGRYVVLMLNSGSYVGVSRKVDDARERQRLRTIANRIRPEGCSLIVRTEADGKTEEELEQDVALLVDLKNRIEGKAAHAPAPSLIHGDLTLIFRLIRDAFTRDVQRVVVDSPSVYENVLELVEMIAPGLKHRVFLYDEALPIFHAYNIEPEMERLLRRKVWLPSGGSLIIDQAEALTAIDVNTGRFVGSTELSDTVLTTNLQAAEEVARQLRLRDLGGIIVVDFIDMDNPRHRQQVTKAFEEALRRDRAKIKVHSISPLGLVEMTRKRTGESLHSMLTEPCPYCSGIGRVQNPLTMALRIERELAAQGVEHPEAEAFLVLAHPRVIASMLGYEGEAQRDLEDYLSRPVYLRMEDDYHPNTYRLEKLALEQALAAVQHVEDGDIIEGQVVNPDPELSLDPLVAAKGIYLIVPGLDAPVGARVKVKVKDVGTSLAFAEPLTEELRAVRTEEHITPRERPPLVPESVLPAYLREELAVVPPTGMGLLSPTSRALDVTGEEEIEEERDSRDRRGRGRRTRRKPEIEEIPIQPLVEEVAAAPAETEAEVEEGAEETDTVRRKRRRRRRKTARVELAQARALDEGETPETEAPEAAETDEVPAGDEAEAEGAETEAPAEGEAPAKRRPRRRGGRRHRKAAPPPELEPQFEEIPPDVAAEALLSMLNAIGGAEEAPAEEAVPDETPAEATEEEIPVVEAPAEEPEPTPAEEAPAEEKPKRRRTTPRRKRAEAAAETAPTPEPEALPVPPVDEAAPTAPAAEPVPPIEEPVAEEAPAAEEKPKRRRTTTRRKKTEPAPEEPGA